MKYPYKSVKYTPKQWKILQELAKTLTAERGTIVYIPGASVEASKKMLDERKNAAATPGGQARG